VTSNPGFKVTGYLKVEYLAHGARVFNCTKQCCRSLAALPKTCRKLGVVAENFCDKSDGRCFTSVTEIKPNRVNLRWNFYADIQLIRGRFWLHLWTVKKFSESRVSWNTLLRCWKIRKCCRRLQRRFVDGRTEVINTAFSSTACRRPPAGGARSKALRLLGVANSYSNGGQIVNTVFVR